ncbi:Transmembrane BAX inhibitor motif-containing protein 4 [Musa troglodytarum]|uniref:Transmembrane BAX inhibitor motif-containing protein 4 n=1 Tax=Musa troglodytarum TaxID=320322 RepID=A0A9E7I3M1_9LILI|nr:Transmembrane BAX inhibitor motif-containing protein 4 [Musa troglodytarum]
MTSRLQHTIPHQSFPRRSPSSSSPPWTPLRLPQPFVPHRRRASIILLIPWSPLAPRMGTRRRTAPVSCTVAERDDEDGTGRGGTATSAAEAAARWASLIPRGVGVAPERILRLISGATSSPIGQFIESPRTFLHSVDPRIKLVWLLVLVVLPARSHIYMRLGLVLYITLLSICILPSRIWTDQLGRVALLSGILFVMLGFGSDSVPSLVQLRTPPPSVTGLSNVPSSLSGYSYIIMKLGPLQLTRKGLSVASTSACLSFTVRNTALGVIARRISWHQLTLMETLDVFFLYIRRIFKNIFSHAEQISKAMIARGFRGDSNMHKIYLFTDFSLGFVDFISILCLLSLIGAAVLSEQLLGCSGDEDTRALNKMYGYDRVEKGVAPGVDIEAGTLYPGLSLGENDLRWGFIRKVYGILAVQVLLTTAVSAATVLYRPVNTALASSPGLVLALALLPLFCATPIVPPLFTLSYLPDL